MEGCGHSWCEGIHQQDDQFEGGSPQPHHEEHRDAIDDGPEDCHWDANQNDKEAVEGQLGVLVGQSHSFVQQSERPGACVLGEAVVKLQLHTGGGAKATLNLHFLHCQPHREHLPMFLLTLGMNVLTSPHVPANTHT